MRFNAHPPFKRANPSKNGSPVSVLYELIRKCGNWEEFFAVVILEASAEEDAPISYQGATVALIHREYPLEKPSEKSHERANRLTIKRLIAT
jgi:hypothetical protein